MRSFIYLVLLSMTFCSCSSDTSIEDQFNADIQLIEDYIKNNNLVTQKTSDGIYYIIDDEGVGPKPKITSKVTCNYTGKFLDETVFDSGKNISFNLSGVIQGWQKGIPKFGKGGKGALIIPSKFGYGSQDVGGRKNAVLYFDIELIDF